MSDSSFADPSLAVLRSLLEEHSSIHHVAQLLGMDHANLGRVLSGEYRLHFELVVRIFEVLDLPISLFHRRCLESRRLELAEAAALLRFCRPRLGRGRPPKAAVHGPFLAGIDDLLPAWLEGEPVDGGMGRREELLQLEDERFHTPVEVKAKLQALAVEILDGPATRAARADLAMALAIWSTLRRIEGRRDEARDGYLVAFRCLEKADDPFRLGFVIQKAAYVAMEFDHLDSSLQLLEGAMANFVLAGKGAWQARVFADRGIVLALQKRWVKAEAELTTALRLLPRACGRYRFACQEALADIYLRLGKLAEAESILEQASANSSGPLAAAFLAWRKGKVLANRAKPVAAANQLWPALTMMKRHGEALDAALVAIDLAGLLLKLDRIEALRSLISEVFGWMGTLATNKAAHIALVKLVGFFYAGELNAQKLEAIRAEMERADRRKRSAAKVWA